MAIPVAAVKCAFAVYSVFLWYGMTLGLCIALAGALAHDGPYAAGEAHTHASDDQAAAWASFALFMVFFCLICGCIVRPWREQAAIDRELQMRARQYYLTDERQQRGSQRSKHTIWQEEHEARDVQRAQMQAMALAQVLEAAQAAQMQRAAQMQQAAPAPDAAHALPPDDVQLEGERGDKYILRACMCGRKNGWVLRLDTTWRMNPSGKLVAEESYAQWQTKVHALTWTQSTRELRITCGAHMFSCTLKDNAELTGLVEGLHKLALATGVTWNTP